MQIVLDDLLISINSHGSISYEYLKHKLEQGLETEKQQHEKIAIDMVNICLDNLNNLDCKMEDEFNKYYTSTFTTNKETLK